MQWNRQPSLFPAAMCSFQDSARSSGEPSTMKPSWISPNPCFLAEPQELHMVARSGAKPATPLHGSPHHVVCNWRDPESCT